MIQKVVRISGIGRFEGCKAQGQVDLKRVTTIYADNGRGKSTFASILRCLHTRGTAELLGRRTLGGGQDPPVVDLRTPNGNVRLQDGEWSGPHVSLAVFDSKFVDSNVYYGSHVHHDIKKNMYELVVGEQSVTLVRAVGELDEQMKDATAATRSKGIEIGKYSGQAFKVDEFVDLSVPADLKQQSDAQLGKVAALRTATETANREGPKVVQLPDLPFDSIVALVSEDLGTVGDAATAITRAHIQACMDAHGEAWVAQGLSYIRDDCCPFCGRGLAGTGLVDGYRAYFSAAYAALRGKVDSMLDRIHSLLSPEALSAIQTAAHTNARLVDSWRQYVNVDLPELDLEALREAWQAVRDGIVAVLQRKHDAPLDPIDVSTDLALWAARYETAANAVLSHNEAVERARAVIDSAKAALTASSLPHEEAELRRLLAMESRGKPEVDALCREYRALMGAHDELVAKKDQAKAELEKHAGDVLARYEKRLNEYMDKFGAEFRIVDVKHTYAGGKPNVTYHIEINDTAVPLGDPDKTPESEPSFRNTLSSGDRSTLALAFFLARLREQADLDSTVVVFDDPITSLDVQRRAATIGEVVGIATRAAQVIVLSHDDDFLRGVWDGWADRMSTCKADRAALAFARSGRGTTIKLWDIEKETEDNYFKNYELLRKYADGTSDISSDFARPLVRPVMEHYLRVRFPVEFRRDEGLDTYLGLVRAAIESKVGRLVDLDPIYGDLDAINAYLGPKGHASKPGAQYTSDEETRSFVRRALKLIR